MSLKKLEELIKNLSLAELKEAKELVTTYYQQKKEEQTADRLIDTYYNQAGVYFRLEKVFCSKDNCSKCQGADKEGHGPYWYSYQNGKREYVGKKSKEELEQIGSFPRLIPEKQDQSLPYKT